MGPISEKLVQLIKSELRVRLEEDVKWIDAEIQDDGEFLLINVETDLAEASEATKKILKAAEKVLSLHIAPRSGEHAWMVNIGHRGALLDSEVGGLA